MYPGNPAAAGTKKFGNMAPKMVFHPYYGYIPLPAGKKDAMMPSAEPEKEVAKQAYVFHPYHGYIPGAELKNFTCQQIFEILTMLRNKFTNKQSRNLT